MSSFEKPSRKRLDARSSHSNLRRKLGLESLEDRRLMAFAVDAPLNEYRAAASDLQSSISIQWKGNKVEVLPNSWIVGLDNAAKMDLPNRLQKSLALSESPELASIHQKWIGSDNVVALQTGKDITYDQLLPHLSSLPGFRYLEPDFIVTTTGTRPNDPSVPSMYGLEKSSAFDAWDLTTGSNSVVIGVIDSGVDYTHPDIVSNLWVNPGEIAGDGIDNDGNGYRDDVYGYDFINGDGNPMDDNGHGTHVAGTIAAAGNNELGVAGVSWSSKIMALKFLGANGSGPTSSAVSALNYATMMRNNYGVNIRVTNNSWGGGAFSQAMSDALTANANSGMLFVASAGNATSNNDATPSYPASYTQANIIAVASTDSRDLLSSFSNYGATTVDVAAPGSSILSLGIGGTYATLSGTSMAAPHVSGAAALLWSAKAQATFAEVRDSILQESDPLDALTGKVASGGRLNIANSVRRVLGDVGDTLSNARGTKLDERGDQFSVPKARIGDGIQGVTDVDIYRWEALAGDVFTAIASVSSTGVQGNLILRIYDSVGNTLLVGDLPTELDSSINFVTPTTGVYYLGVSSGSNDAYNPLVAGSGIGGVLADYSLEMRLDLGDNLPNAKIVNLAPESSYLQYRTSLGDGLLGDNDVDLYRFNASAGMLLSAYSTQTTSGASSSPILRLFDSQGIEVSSLSPNSSSKPYLDRRIPISGTYYLGVSIAGNASYDPANPVMGSPIDLGDYSLTISLSAVLPSTAAEYSLESLVGSDGGDGFVISGLAASSSLQGPSISQTLGDINNDGIDDFLMTQTGGSGTFFIVYGRNTTIDPFGSELDLNTLDGNNGYRVTGLQATSTFGLVSGGAGDVNGDGLLDIVISESSNTPSADRVRAGASFVIFGGQLSSLDAADGFIDGTISIANLDGTRGFTIFGTTASGSSRAAAIGDFNADGFDDLGIGAPNISTNVGEAYILYGRSTFTPIVELTNLNG